MGDLNGDSYKPIYLSSYSGGVDKMPAPQSMIDGIAIQIYLGKVKCKDFDEKRALAGFQASIIKNCEVESGGKNEFCSTLLQGPIIIPDI
jgi:hypothetical protein